MSRLRAWGVRHEGGGVLWLCGMGLRTGDDEEGGKLEFCHDAGCSEVWSGVGLRVWRGARMRESAPACVYMRFSRQLVTEGNRSAGKI